MRGIHTRMKLREAHLADLKISDRRKLNEKLIILFFVTMQKS